MNILKTREIETNDDIRKLIYPEFNVNDNELTSYIFCKSFNALDLENIDNIDRLLIHVFTIQELEHLCATYLALLAEKGDASLDSFLKENGKFEFEEVLNSVFKSVVKEPEVFRQIAGYECTRKLESVFKDSNPIDKFLSSEFMRNFTSAFMLSDMDALFLVLVIYDEMHPWFFHRVDSLSQRAEIFAILSNTPRSKCMEYIQNQNQLISHNLLGSSWSIQPHVRDYFVQNDKVYNLEELKEDPFCDSISLEALDQYNHKSMDFMAQLLEMCRDDDGCIILMDGQNEYRLKNYLAHFCHTQNRPCFLFSNPTTLPSKEELTFYLVAYSAQVKGKGGVIVLDRLIADILMPIAPDSDIVNPLFSDTWFSDNNKRERKTLNLYSFCDLIQAPVVLFADPFMAEEIDRNGRDDDDNFNFIKEQSPRKLKGFARKMMFHWKVQAPPRSQYAEQLAKYLRHMGVPETYIGCATEECKRLQIPPESWDLIAERITTANGVSEENIRTLINSMVDDSNSTIEFRSKAYYNLSALRTSISVEEVIESIRNAEKWQGNQQDSESGLRILLYGISGTGKTAFVEYIADMIDKPLQCIRTSDIMRSKAGATEHNIKVSFRNAAQSGAILLIDEADTLLRSRKDVQYNWEASMTNEFIQQMERFPGILFCNTNLPEFLDTATNRRFHMQIKFESLDTAGIEKLCESYFGRFSFTQRQISEIHASGEVCPGDFGAVFGRLRFADPEKLSTEFIVQELVNTIRAKTADKSSGRKIGF